MNGFNQIFQVMAQNVQPFNYSRTLGSQDNFVTENTRGVIAPGCTIMVQVKNSFAICGEMSSALELQFDENLPPLGSFFPFFVFNFPIKNPCGKDLYLCNIENFPIDYNIFWAKEK